MHFVLPLLVRRCFPGEQYIVLAGDVVESAYFILQGKVQLVDREGYLVTTLEEGSSFNFSWATGNPPLATQSIRTVGDCVALELQPDDLAKLKQLMPSLVEAFVELETSRTTFSLFRSRGFKMPLPPYFRSWMEVGADKTSNLFRHLHAVKSMSRRNQIGTFAPDPLDTSSVSVPPFFPRIIQAIAENNHMVWAQDKMQRGWKWG